MKIKDYLKNSILSLAVVSALGIGFSGCGGSSGGGDDSTPTETVETPIQKEISCDDSQKLVDNTCVEKTCIDDGYNCEEATGNMDRSYYGLWRYVDNGEELIITSNTTLDYEIENNDLLKTTQGDARRYLMRASVANAKISGELLVEEDGGIRSLRSGYKGAGGINIIVNNITDNELKSETQTDTTGHFEDDGHPSGTTVEITAQTADGKTLKTEIPINTSSIDLGSYILKDIDDYNFKASIETDDEFVYGTNTTRDATVKLKNIGNIEGTDVSYKIYQDDELIKSGISGTIRSGETNNIPVEFQSKTITQNESLINLKVNMFDSNGKTWEDTTSLKFYKECFDININSAGAAIKGYIILPNGNVQNININETGTIQLPTIDEQYALVLSNSDRSTSQNIYTIGIGTVPLDIDLDFIDTAAHEPNNERSNGTVLNYNDKEISYLGYGDIDYWIISSPEQTIGTASYCGNEAPIVSAGNDKVVIEGTNVTFEASANDSDGNIASYQWKDDSTVLSTEVFFSKSDFSVGVHNITLTVTDNYGALSTDTLNLTVNKIIEQDGLKYGTIVSSITSRTWLDRNLGASKICTSLYDEECYGDYYQWGRNKDGHEKSNSSTTSVEATNIYNVGHGNFITTEKRDWSSLDLDGLIRKTNWNPCPDKYRIPTFDELTEENIDGRNDAYSKLKLPSAGYRRYVSGELRYDGFSGYLWASSTSSFYSEYLAFYGNGSSDGIFNRSFGLSVRCIKDEI